VSKALALLKLPADIQVQIDAGELSASSGYEISRLKSEDAQRELVQKVVDQGLDRDETGEVVGKTARPKKSTDEKRAKTTKTINVSDARIMITWHKKAVRTKDIVDALKEALAQFERTEESTAA
jgi:ParB family chromosome partitioning protein